jgi:RNA polymerase sigma-70 factor (ECF subfamily)
MLRSGLCCSPVPATDGKAGTYLPGRTVCTLGHTLIDRPCNRRRSSCAPAAPTEERAACLTRTKDPCVMTEDRRLVLECLRGENAAFEELVRKYQDRLFNAVYRLVDNAEDATDVVQEAFLSAYQSLHSFKGESEWYTWLYRIAVNSAISLKRRRPQMIHLGGHNAGEPWSQLADSSAGTHPEHGLEREEEERRVQQALNQLPAKDRAVLILKEVDGLSYEAVAQVLQVPIGTIRSRLHRARMKLRRLLLEEEDRH